MNRIVVFLFIIFISACTSNEKKAENACKKYLNETLHDFKSYESVSWGSLDSSYTVADSSDEIKNLEYEFNIIKNDLQKRLDSMQIYGDAWRAIGEFKWRLDFAIAKKDEMQKINNMIDSITKNWKPEFNGYKIKHTFRSKTLSGNYKISHYVFYLNKELDKVIGQEDNSEI